MVDDWRAQHENLLAMYRVAEAALHDAGLQRSEHPRKGKAETMLEVEYRRWLSKEGYQATTVYNSLSSTRVAEKQWQSLQTAELQGLSETAFASYTTVLKRYSRFLHSIPFPRWSPFERFVVDSFDAAIPPTALGSTRKPSLTQEQWARLVVAVSAGTDPVDRALSSILSMGLEPREALATPLRLLRGYADVLEEKRKKNLTLGEYVSAGEGSYRRVQRQLYKYAEELGFSVDFRSIMRTLKEIRRET